VLESVNISSFQCTHLLPSHNRCSHFRNIIPALYGQVNIGDMKQFAINGLALELELELVRHSSHPVDYLIQE
jgi:hypothetical protein